MNIWVLFEIRSPAACHQQSCVIFSRKVLLCIEIWGSLIWIQYMALATIVVVDGISQVSIVWSFFLIGDGPIPYSMVSQNMIIVVDLFLHFICKKNPRMVNHQHWPSITQKQRLPNSKTKSIEPKFWGPGWSWIVRPGNGCGPLWLAIWMNPLWRLRWSDGMLWCLPSKKTYPTGHRVSAGTSSIHLWQRVGGWWDGRGYVFSCRQGNRFTSWSSWSFREDMVFLHQQH